MTIETKRLILVALNPEQLETLANNVSKLEKEIGCSYQGEKIEGIFKSILQAQCVKAKTNVNFYLWHTFWLIIKKEDNVIVGTIDFKGEPNTKGEVEIGYGLGKLHEHYGYMTEAVQAFCKWGKEQETVQYITAETEVNNFASQRLLQRCGFIECDRDSTIWWRL